MHEVILYKGITTTSGSVVRYWCMVTLENGGGGGGSISKRHNRLALHDSDVAADARCGLALIVCE